ncbi:MAG: S-methyl-5'-thioadenosine phosphorylase, partial [Nioella sp.]
ASVAMITDYDSWHPHHGEVDIGQIIATLQGNADKARDLVSRLPALLGNDRNPCEHGCDRALEHAILTAPDKRDAGMVAALSAVAGRVL